VVAVAVADVTMAVDVAVAIAIPATKRCVACAADEAWPCAKLPR